MQRLSVDDYLSLPTVIAERRIAYGEHPAQFGDLFLPAGHGPHPLLILIHGGCWRAQYDLEPMSSLADALRRLGMAVWSLEYRRLGAGGGWPETFADIATGADLLYSLAKTVDLDLGRVVAAGHSAGGQLALWLAARKQLPATNPLRGTTPLPVGAVLALAALADLEDAAARGLCNGAVLDLLGGPPAEQSTRFAQASPAALLPLSLPQYHLVGSDDTIVPPDYLQAYASRAANEPIQIEILPAAGHFELVDPRSSAWPSVRRAAQTLVETHHAGPVDLASAERS